jgi:CHASE2 domain-containing sensor protein
VDKLVVLKFAGGTIAQGFQVAMQVGELQARPTIERSALLPADPELAKALQTWRTSYQQLDFSGSSNTRAKGKPGQTKHPQDRQQDCRSASQALITRFNQWLESPSFRTIRETWLEALPVSDRIQVMIQTESAELQQLPWHLWDLIERYGKLEVTIAATDYQSNLALDSSVDRHHKSVKILAILGDASGIDIQTDRALLSALPQAKVDFLVEPKREDLSETLWSKPIDILFFAGHSSSQGAAGRVFINQTESLSLKELRYALKKAINNGLQLAIFNSCDGLGLAKELSDLQIPQIIVMREPVPDRVAQTFLRFFLASFSTGESLYAAVREARERLQGMEGEFLCASWLPLVVQHPIAVAPTWPSLLGEVDPITQQRRFSFRTLISRPLLKWMPIAAVVSTIGIAGLRHFGILQSMELSGYDAMLQIRSQEPPDNRILVIEVTEEDVQKQSAETRRGSLSDQAFSEVMEKLKPMQPVTIGLDIYRDYPVSKPFKKLATQLKEDPNFITICRTSDPVYKLAAIDPPPEVAPDQLGFSNLVVDSDLIVRRHLIALTPEANSACAADYALSTQLALRYLAHQKLDLDFDAAGNWIIGKKKFRAIESHTGGYQGVDAWGHQLLLNYRNYRHPSEVVPRVTLGQVRSGKLKREDVQGKIILIGTTAESFKDSVVTPFRNGSQPIIIPGVIMQAQMTSQLISHVLDDRPLITTFPFWGDLLWIALWGVAGTYVGTFRRRLYVGIGIGILYTIVSIACGVMMITVALWLPWIPAMGSIAMGAATIKAIGAVRSK